MTHPDDWLDKRIDFEFGNDGPIKDTLLSRKWTVGTNTTTDPGGSSGDLTALEDQGRPVDVLGTTITVSIMPPNSRTLHHAGKISLMS